MDYAPGLQPGKQMLDFYTLQRQLSVLFPGFNRIGFERCFVLADWTIQECPVSRRACIGAICKDRLMCLLTIIWGVLGFNVDTMFISCSPVC